MFIRRKKFVLAILFATTSCNLSTNQAGSKSNRSLDEQDIETECDNLWEKGERKEALTCYDNLNKYDLNKVPAVASEQNLPAPVKDELEACMKNKKDMDACMKQLFDGFSSSDMTKANGKEEPLPGIGQFPDEGDVEMPEGSKHGPSD